MSELMSPEVLVHDRLSVELIRRDLETERVGCQIYLLWEVTSTNDVLKKLAEAGAREGAVVLAEAQTAGRGRLGKPWFSPPGTNLYASALFRPAITPASVPVFSFIASLAVSDAIWAEGVSAGIKWPNDVLVGGRKAAGTLAAWALAGEIVEYVILGVGINLNVQRGELRAGLGAVAADATSVREAAGRPIDRNRFCATFLNCLERWADTYDTRGPETVLAAWRARDVLTGRSVEIRGEGAPYQARVLGANHHGHLVVENERGELQELAAAEVRVLP